MQDRRARRLGLHAELEGRSEHGRAAVPERRGIADGPDRRARRAAARAGAVHRQGEPRLLRLTLTEQGNPANTATATAKTTALHPVPGEAQAGTAVAPDPLPGLRLHRRQGRVRALRLQGQGAQDRAPRAQDGALRHVGEARPPDPGRGPGHRDLDGPVRSVQEVHRPREGTITGVFVRLRIRVSLVPN